MSEKKPVNIWGGNVIRELRHRSGLSQRKLADISGLSRRSIYLWENGLRSITLEHLVMLCAAMGYMPNFELTEGDRNETN